MAKKPNPYSRDRYWRSLGKFVDAFASIETGIHLLLYERTRTELEIAQVVFSGTRVQVAMDYIKRVSAFQKLDKATLDDQDYIFTQLGHLNGFRNNLLHSEATPAAYIADGSFTASNWLRAGPAKARTDVVSSSTLLDAARDLVKIKVHLIERHLWREPGLGSPFSKQTLALLDAAWKYKPLLLNPKNRKRRGKGQGS